MYCIRKMHTRGRENPRTTRLTFQVNEFQIEYRFTFLTSLLVVMDDCLCIRVRVRSCLYYLSLKNFKYTCVNVTRIRRAHNVP